MTDALTTEPVQSETEKPEETANNSPAPYLVGLNEAARLTGASKTTILKYAEDGTLSYEFNAQKKKVYQVAELQRVFPKMKVQNGSAKEQIDHDEPKEVPDNTAHKLELLEQENRFLKEKLEAEAEKASREAQNAQDWKNQCERMTLMLTHRPEPTPVPEPQATPEPQPVAAPKRKFLGIFGGN
jgi:hypothetical protein